MSNKGEDRSQGLIVAKDVFRLHAIERVICPEEHHWHTEGL